MNRKKILTLFLAFTLFFNCFPVYSSASWVVPAVKTGLQWLGPYLVSYAFDKVTTGIDGWLSSSKNYYDSPHTSSGGVDHGGGGSSRGTPNYYDNNTAFEQYKNTNSITNSTISDSFNNTYMYTSNTTNNTSNYSLVKQTYTTNNEYNTLVYNPINQTYNTVNNISYNYDLDTYYITNNDYDYYITNNYTYVSYYIVNNQSQEYEYAEVYYSLPDGRNSYDLKKEDVWGKYFVYNVTSYDFVAEDDGTTLGLFHFDNSLKDESFSRSPDVVGGNGVFSSGKFGTGYTISDRTEVHYSPFDTNNFTIEFFMCVSQLGHLGCINIYVPEFLESELGCVDDDIYVLNLGISSSGVYHIVLQRDSGVFSWYKNGKKQANLIRRYDDFPTFSLSSSKPSYCVDGDISFGPNAIAFYGFHDMKQGSNGGDPYWHTSFFGETSIPWVLDELRISNCAIYSGNTINVMQQPFDTNKVLTVPNNPQENDIAVMANYEVSEYRIGGVRPTYPSDGFVYVSLENDVVTSVQQFEGSTWEERPAVIYMNGEWSDLYDMNLKDLSYEIRDDDSGDEVDPDGGDDSADAVDPDGGDDSGSSGGSVSSNGSGGDWSGLGSGLSSIVDAISGFLGLILDSIGKIITLVTDFFNSFLSMFDSFTVFTEGFGNFLKSAFVFLPEEVVTALVVGINICVVIAIFKFMRN